MAKPKYEPWLEGDGLDKIETWSKAGLTISDIAQNMGIGERTLYEWMNLHPQISQSLKRGKAVADEIVQNALFNSAIGFHYDEESLTNDGRVVELKKYAKPNTTAQIFWLKNRKSEWNDKQEMDVNVRTVIVDDITDED
ncbi:helix-turn-helix domain-containing protein [Exiguobacterium sp. S22-S28]|uniref:helix-turn-helix domain-containing protein n=1 Tax=Exiguobacterium sp. S22-S28 TaxID=3342768 RepID=UPI00372D0687